MLIRTKVHQELNCAKFLTTKVCSKVTIHKRFSCSNYQLYFIFKLFESLIYQSTQKSSMILLLPNFFFNISYQPNYEKFYYSLKRWKLSTFKEVIHFTYKWDSVCSIFLNFHILCRNLRNTTRSMKISSSL